MKIYGYVRVSSKFSGNKTKEEAKNDKPDVTFNSNQFNSLLNRIKQFETKNTNAIS